MTFQQFWHKRKWKLFNTYPYTYDCGDLQDAKDDYEKLTSSSQTHDNHPPKQHATS